MSEPFSDLKRVASASGVYATAAVFRRGLSFILLPIYTRYLEPAEYGALELFNALSGILFAALLLGQPAAFTKCFHRDCETEDERKKVLATAILIDLPALIFGGLLLFAFAEPVGSALIGRAGLAEMVRLVVATAILASLMAIVLSNFRARERSIAYALLSLAQFVPAMILNIVFVVVLDLGITGVLWGNLLSTMIALPLALWAARHDAMLAIERRLLRPLFSFGTALIPVALAGWVISLSDRYVLRLFDDLSEVAVYSVGYKIGSILNLTVVWPFQLAWPAVSFSISKREGHQESYAKALTYLFVVLVMAAMGLSLISRSALTLLTGPAYAAAVQVIPWVALAYVFNGVQYCVSPGVHIQGKTKYFAVFSMLAAGLNLGLNLLLVPHFGVMGATWATTATFMFQAAAVATLAQRVYPVRYEVVRLGKIAAAGALTYYAAVLFEPAGVAAGVAWHVGCVMVGFPILLVIMKFVEPAERSALRSAAERALSWTKRRGSTS